MAGGGYFKRVASSEYEYKVGPAPEVFVFGGLYQFLLYFYDTFLANFLVLGAAPT